MIDTWLVTGVGYNIDSGLLELTVQTHDYKYKDANYLLGIVGTLGLASSWEPDFDQPEYGCSGTLRVFPHTRLLVRIVKFCQRKDTIQALSEVTGWLNRELQKARGL